MLFRPGARAFGGMTSLQTLSPAATLLATSNLLMTFGHPKHLQASPSDMAAVYSIFQG